MALFDFPLVRAGQEITAKLWNDARNAVRAGRLFTGKGIRLKWTESGTIISADGSSADWSHAFQVALIGTSQATISAGLINGSIEPTIDKVPLSGSDEVPVPVLAWKTLQLDQAGKGYIAVEVTCSKDWVAESAIIVQCAQLETEAANPPAKKATAATGGIMGLPGRRARYGLARIRRLKSGGLACFQIPYFNLTHQAQPKSLDADNARHFFY